LTAARSVPDGATRLRDALARRHLLALDGLRAVAVLTVIVYHFGIDAVPGDLGVSLFFVLSGFLITWLLIAERRATGNVSLRAFYTRRVLRIFPAYYAFVAVSFALDHWRGSSWPHGLMPAALLYYVNYFNGLHDNPATSLFHAWSLAIEEQFYILWPLCFLLLMRRGARSFTIALVALIAGVLLWRSYLYLDRGVGAAYVYNAFDTRFDNLAIGCLLAVWLAQDRYARPANAVGRYAWLPLVTVALLLVSRTRTPLAYHYTLGFTVDAVLLAILIVQMLQWHPSRGWRWLEYPAVRYLGIISYGMYLYHQWGLGAGRHIPSFSPVEQLGAGIVATIIAATGSYYVIERPFLALKRRFERGRSAAGAPSAAKVDTVAAQQPVRAAT
jgi:peptidoglycan/LPS O-acetylase OafA/YrhL